MDVEFSAVNMATLRERNEECRTAAVGARASGCWPTSLTGANWSY